MADLTFLDKQSDLYATHKEAWLREERRLEGGDGILAELIQFAAEATDSFDARKQWARWLGFGQTHTSLLSGHIRRATPVPMYGKLGEVRTRRDQDAQTLAELFHFNVDGVGNDGQQLESFMDGVLQRAMATGFRWLMAELPTKETLRSIRVRLGTLGADQPLLFDGQVTDEEVRAGFRTFLVERSPLAGQNHRVRDGVLEWVNFRIPVDPVLDFATEASTGLGFYLMVRQGYRGLGPDFEAGGWWKYDATKALIDEGRWDDTDGDIPVWLQVGEPGRGTHERPSIGKSSTMELGQISADLMNAISEQRFNLRQAAKSINYWIGIDKVSHDSMTEQLKDGSISTAVPPALWGDGTWHAPTLANSSGFVLDSAAYEGVIVAAVAQAKEIMVRQVTAGVDASGVSREAAFGEATSPLLAKIAASAEQGLNTMGYFVGRRMGLSRADASQISVQLPRDFKIRDVVSDIDAMLDRMATAAVRSRTWEAKLLERKGESLDLLPDDEDRDKITAELNDPRQDKGRLETLLLQAQVIAAFVDGGASEAGAAEEVGLTPEQVRRLYATVTPGTPDIQPAAVGGGVEEPAVDVDLEEPRAAPPALPGPSRTAA